jgi:threonine dehydrogenase-like Zn-dependent dehydrogenase
MELVRHGRLDLTPLLTHTFFLDRITEAYKVFGERREGVIKWRSNRDGLQEMQVAAQG